MTLAHTQAASAIEREYHRGGAAMQSGTDLAPPVLLTILGELDQLSKSVDSLDSVVSMLETQLGSLLRPQLPADVRPALATAKSEPLAIEQAIAVCQRVDQITEFLVDMRNRLAV